MDIKWDKKYETGIDKIDEQHRGFFEKLDQLELAIYAGRGSAELIKMMEFLDNYVLNHFELEEKIMLDNSYSGFAAHAHQHNEFRRIFAEILASLKSRGADSYLAIDIDKKLRRWFENHILKTDMALIPFIKNIK